MRALGLSVISILLTSAVIGNAYYQKKQFYPSVVYITKSNPSMAVSIIALNCCCCTSSESLCCLMFVFVFRSIGHLCSIACWGLNDGQTDEKGICHYLVDTFNCISIVWNFILDFLRNIKSSRIWTLNGTILVCTHWNLFGLHCIQRWFQSEICCTIYGATLLKVIPLVSRRAGRLCKCCAFLNFDRIFHTYWF